MSYVVMVNLSIMTSKFTYYSPTSYMYGRFFNIASALGNPHSPYLSSSSIGWGLADSVLISWGDRISLE